MGQESTEEEEPEHAGDDHGQQTPRRGRVLAVRLDGRLGIFGFPVGPRHVGERHDTDQFMNIGPAHYG